MRVLLEISDLNVHYGRAKILKEISLNLEEGEIVTIIGSNGSGKTTILRTISGVKRPTTGKILFQGRGIQKTPAQTIVKMGIGHVPQGRNLFPYMSVLENIRLGAFLQKNDAQDKENLEQVFQTFPVMKARKKQRAGTLSGGEQQMLAIARALMGNPRLLLLDEPSIGLAPLMVREIGEVVVKINREKGTSILLVEQNARLALRLAHRGYVLEIGSIVLNGKGEELLGDERVKKAYLGQS